MPALPGENREEAFSTEILVSTLTWLRPPRPFCVLHVNQSLLIAEIYQHSITSTTLTWLRPPRLSHGLRREIVWIYLVFCVLYVNHSLPVYTQKPKQVRWCWISPNPARLSAELRRNHGHRYWWRCVCSLEGSVGLWWLDCPCAWWEHHRHQDRRPGRVRWNVDGVW